MVTEIPLAQIARENNPAFTAVLLGGFLCFRAELSISTHHQCGTQILRPDRFAKSGNRFYWSHRGSEFVGVYEQATAPFKSVLGQDFLSDRVQFGIRTSTPQVIIVDRISNIQELVIRY